MNHAHNAIIRNKNVIMQDTVVVGNSNKALEFAYKTCSFLICTTPQHFTNTEILYKHFLRGLVFQYSLNIIDKVKVIDNELHIATNLFSLIYSFNKLYVIDRMEIFDSINIIYEKENNITFNVTDVFKANNFIKSGLDESYELDNDELKKLTVFKRDITLESRIHYTRINEFEMSGRQFHMLISAFLRSKELNTYRHNDVIKEHVERKIEWEKRGHSYAINNNKIIFFNI